MVTPSGVDLDQRGLGGLLVGDPQTLTVAGHVEQLRILSGRNRADELQRREVDDADRLLGTHLHHKSPSAKLLSGSEGQLGVHLGTNRAIRVIPKVHHAHADQLIDPLLSQKVVDVRLAEARANAGQ